MRSRVDCSQYSENFFASLKKSAVASGFSTAQLSASTAGKPAATRHSAPLCALGIMIGNLAAFPDCAADNPGYKQGKEETS